MLRGLCTEWDETAYSAAVTLGNVTATVKPEDGKAEIVNNRIFVPFDFITGLERESKPEERRELYDFARAWATALCRRDGFAMYALYADEEAFLKAGQITENGIPVIGISSPWPWFAEEANVIIDGADISCVFWFRTSMSVEARRFTLSYIKAEDGFKVSDVKENFPDASSKTAFDYIYDYGFPPFAEISIDGDSGDPVKSVSAQLRIENAEALVETRADGSAVINYTWEDGSVLIHAKKSEREIMKEDGIWVPVGVITSLALL